MTIDELESLVVAAGDGEHGYDYHNILYCPRCKCDRTFSNAARDLIAIARAAERFAATVSKDAVWYHDVAASAFSELRTALARLNGGGKEP